MTFSLDAMVPVFNVGDKVKLCPGIRVPFDDAYEPLLSHDAIYTVYEYRDFIYTTSDITYDGFVAVHELGMVAQKFASYVFPAEWFELA